MGPPHLDEPLRVGVGTADPLEERLEPPGARLLEQRPLLRHQLTVRL